MVELYRQSAIAPRITQSVAVVGGQREFQAETPCGIRKLANLVTGGRSEKQKTLGH
jgi:hypothetical protein